jgi:hypothetical protein
MVDDVIAGLALKGTYHRIEPAFGEFGYLATDCTDDAVGMVLAAQDIPMAIINAMDTLHDTDVGEQFEGAEQACIPEGMTVFA